jgi:hypothetical protein
MSAALQHIESHWNSTVIPSILEQYKDAGKWQAMLKAVIDQMQIAEDAAAELTTVLDFESEMPTGDRLDFIAGLVNVTRMAGETDELFYTRFITSLGNRRAGTPDFVINSTKFLSLDPHPQYFDEADCTFFVYTGPRPVMVSSQNVVTENGQNLTTEAGGSLMTEPVQTSEWEQGGRQLKREQVRRMSPAGVLGLPGEGLQFADGSFMGDALGRIFLAVADDNDVPFVADFDFITNEGLLLVTDADAILAGQSKEG